MLLVLDDPRRVRRMRSANVDLPWSMCAMMQKFRIREGSVNVSRA